MIEFVAVLFVVHATTASYEAKVKANDDNVCTIQHFDWFRTADYVENLFRRIEKDFENHAMYYDKSIFDTLTSRRDLDALVGPFKDPKKSDEDPKSSKDPVKGPLKNLKEIVKGLSHKDVVYQLFTFLRQLRVSVLRYTNECHLGEILKWLEKDTTAKMQTKEACSVGTHLRVIEHMAKLYKWQMSTSPPEEQRAQNIKEKVRSHFASILSILIPELKFCYLKPTREYDDVIIHIADSIQITHLKQACSNRYFKHTDLTLFDVENYLPSDEAAYVHNAGQEIVGPIGFHMLMQYASQHFIPTKGIIRTSGSLSKSMEDNVQKLSFAVIRKPLEGEDNKQNEIRVLLESLIGDFAVFTFVRTLKLFLKIISLAYDPQLPSNPPDTVTSSMINMVHEQHGRHPCIEAMFFELFRFLQLVAESSAVNGMTASNLAIAIGPSIINIYGEKDVTEAIYKMRMESVIKPFLETLIEHTNYELVKNHFTEQHTPEVASVVEHGYKESAFQPSKKLAMQKPSSVAGANTPIMNELNSHLARRNPEYPEEPREAMSAGPSMPRTFENSDIQKLRSVEGANMPLMNEIISILARRNPENSEEQRAAILAGPSKPRTSKSQPRYAAGNAAESVPLPTNLMRELKSELRAKKVPDKKK